MVADSYSLACTNELRKIGIKGMMGETSHSYFARITTIVTLSEGYSEDFCGINSIIMISLGIIGYYISKIYEEVKGRPRYIITDTCGDEEK